MPRWLKKMGKLADKITDSVVERVTEKVTSELGSVDDLGPAVSKLKETALQCHQTARETVEICAATEDKRQAMIDFASEIQSTLSGLKDADASVLETIKQLTEGQRIESAIALARGLDETAVQCVEKSIKMIDTMEDGMDSLPGVVQKAIEHAAGSSDDDDNDDDDDDDDEEDIDLLKDLDRDIADVKTCIDSLQHLNLVTAFKVGLEAFTQLTEKAKSSRSMFESIQDYAKDVEEITGGFQDMNVRSVISKAKDLLRCIRMGDVMRKLAEAAGKLVKILIELFQATSERISTLWGALAFAKDCMADCMTHVTEAKQLCVDASDKSTLLIERSLAIKDQLEDVGEVNMKSIGAVRELSDGEEIKEAIALARSMDDLVMACTGKVVSMVDRVTEGFKNLPGILTEGIDVSTEGKQDDDPDPANMEDDITEIEAARSAVEEADVIHAVRAGVEGFSGVSEKTSVSRDQLQLVEGFAGSCNATIESFMGSWDLEAAANKITEMCRLVNLGEMMKQFADQIKRLVVAMIALMTAAVEKFSKMDMKELVGDLGDKVDDAVEMGKDKLNVEDLGEAMGDAMDKVKGKLKFWKN
jgi:hypothetical protein